MVPVATTVFILLLSTTLVWYLRAGKAPLKIVDVPNDRSLHLTPIPRTGGVAILVSLACGLALTSPTILTGPDSEPLMKELLWIVAALALVAGVSLADDRWHLSAALRLPIHLGAALMVVFGAGASIRTIPFPGTMSLSLGIFGPIVSVLFITWMANLFNFMDGMDGLASAMAIVGLGTLGYLAWTNGDPMIPMFALVAVPAVAGFMFFNFPPARIFMGDAGSVPLGFLCGTLSCVGVSKGAFDIWVPLIVFSPFVVDATVTLLRRALQGKRVWEAHREHYYQRLVLSGWSHARTLLAEVLVMLAASATAIGYVVAPRVSRALLAMSWIAVYLLFAYMVRRIERHTPAS